MKKALLITIILLPLHLQAQEQNYRVTKCTLIAQHTPTPYQKSVSSAIGSITITPAKIFFDTNCFEKSLAILSEKNQNGTRNFELNYRLKTTFTITGSTAELDVAGQFKAVFELHRK